MASQSWATNRARYRSTTAPRSSVAIPMSPPVPYAIISRSVQGHVHVLDPGVLVGAEPHDRPVERQPVETFLEHLQQYAVLGAGEVRPQTEVAAMAEGQMGVRAAGDDEGERVIEDGLVAV